MTLSSQKWPTLSRRANIVKGVVDRAQPTLFRSLSLLTLVLCLNHPFPSFSLALPPHFLLLSFSTPWNVDRAILSQGVMGRQQLTSDCAISCRVLSSGRGKPHNDPSKTSLLLRDPFSCANHINNSLLIFGARWHKDIRQHRTRTVTETRAHTHPESFFSVI